MKLLLISSILIGVIAEPPRFRPARFRLQRQELTTTELPESTTDSAPYPASGWKPAGEPFTLPDKTSTPADSYGAPNAPYPASGWKPEGQAFTLPQESTPGTDDAYASTQSTENQAEKIDGPVEVQKSLGLYYILLPNGQLQKIEFLSENDIRNLKYTALLKIPDRAPLYLFGP